MNFNPLITVMVGISAFMWIFTNFFRTDIPAEVLTERQRNLSVVVVGEEGREWAEDFDLQGLPAIVQEATDAADLEAKINAPEGINNLDLNNDGEVDFVRVTEFGDRSVDKAGKYGFSLTVEVEPGVVQEIATVEVIPQGDRVEVATYGNEGIYGSGHGYRSFFPASSFFFLGYLLNSSSFYSSPYGYGRYPSYHSPFSAADRNAYTRRASKFNQSFSGSTVNRGPTMSSPFSQSSQFSQVGRRGLRNSSGFQKGFGGLGSRNRQTVGSGGFGRSGINTGRTRNPFRGIGSGFGRNRGLGGISSRRSFGGLRGFGGFRGFRGFKR